ncbi:DnaJ subfamily C member 9 [Willisornis vidua]|uniref:DnaJ subfamily C member 9 n=1 Tax=Willisornis vidua TaxID=1566151 RepID=A0ABQ9DXH9_9PASS|nr:DnaJ subfamily C member 9 [Willisornis vidua]
MSGSTGNRESRCPSLPPGTARLERVFIGVTLPCGTTTSSGCAQTPSELSSKGGQQVLGKVYAVLSDANQRAVYDQTGTVDEEAEALRDDRDWLEYWQLLFKLTVKDIEDFQKNYKNSEEEVADVKAAYLNFQGDMDRIMESVMCADYTDEPRIREMIQQAIDSGELPSYKAFVKESKQKMMSRRKRAEKEAEEAKKTQEELGLGGENDLQALIQCRSKDRERQMDDFLAQMEAKYGNNAKKGGKKTAAKKRKAEGTA